MLKHLNGRLLFFPAGFPKPTMDFDPNTLHYRKIEFIGTINGDNADFIDASKMLSTGLIDVSKSLEGKTFPFAISQRPSTLLPRPTHTASVLICKGSEGKPC